MGSHPSHFRAMRTEVEELGKDLAEWKEKLREVKDPKAQYVYDELAKYVSRWSSYGLGKHVAHGKSVTGFW